MLIRGFSNFRESLFSTSMKEIIVFLDGCSKSEAATVLKVYEEDGCDAKEISMVPITDKLAAMVTAQALKTIEEGKWPGGTVRTGQPRSVLINTLDKKKAIAIMRAFKKILPKNHNTAFAIITAQGVTWTIQSYLTHIHKEHEYMKRNDPASDPDMRPL